MSKSSASIYTVSFRTVSLLTFALIAIPHSAKASLFFSGGYVSLGLGGLWEKGKHKFSDPSKGDGTAKVNSIGPAGSLNLGYITEMNLSTVMLGGEIYYFLPSYGKRVNLIPNGASSQGNGRIERKGSYGIALIGGKLMSPKVMVYAKVGFDIAPTQFKYRNLSFGSASIKTYKHSFKKITVGAGFRYAFSDKIHLGAEYNVANLGTYKVRNASVLTDGAYRGIQVKLVEQRVLATLTYKFG